MPPDRTDIPTCTGEFDRLVSAVRAALAEAGYVGAEAPDKPRRGMTPNDVARLLRKSPDWVRAEIAAGRLGALNLAKSKVARPQYVVLPEHLSAFAEQRKAAAPAEKPPRRKRRPAGQVDFFPD